MMNRQQQWQRMMALAEEGERRGRAVGITGGVHLKDYLNPEEQQELLQLLRSFIAESTLPQRLV